MVMIGCGLKGSGYGDGRVDTKGSGYGDGRVDTALGFRVW